jgi:hypothetical protein
MTVIIYKNPRQYRCQNPKPCDCKHFSTPDHFRLLEFAFKRLNDDQQYVEFRLQDSLPQKQITAVFHKCPDIYRFNLDFRLPQRC